jgi:hypothetical protein
LPAQEVVDPLTSLLVVDNYFAHPGPAGAFVGACDTVHEK